MRAKGKSLQQRRRLEAGRPWNLKRESIQFSQKSNCQRNFMFCIEKCSLWCGPNWVPFLQEGYKWSNASRMICGSINFFIHGFFFCGYLCLLCLAFLCGNTWEWELRLAARSLIRPLDTSGGCGFLLFLAGFFDKCGNLWPPHFAVNSLLPPSQLIFAPNGFWKHCSLCRVDENPWIFKSCLNTNAAACRHFCTPVRGKREAERQRGRVDSAWESRASFLL